MTHSTVTEDKQNSGSFESVYLTIDISSLDNAGSETFDPAAEANLRDVLGISVNGQESEGMFIRWDHVAGNLAVTDASDGTAVASGTDVGEVILKIDGNVAP